MFNKISKMDSTRKDVVTPRTRTYGHRRFFDVRRISLEKKTTWSTGGHAFLAPNNSNVYIYFPETTTVPNTELKMSCGRIAFGVQFFPVPPGRW